MRIADKFKDHIPVSFEIFPPKGELGVDTLRSILDEFKALEPDYISVTYSAGGSGNSEKTVELVNIIENEYGIDASAHLTCINSNIGEVRSVLEQLKADGIENILALRGDRIDGKSPSDFHYASELISYIKKENDKFCIGAACYPEGHIECDSFSDDIRHLKEKQDAGADFLVTQLFFENELFYTFREKAVAAGINIPIEAGIMPILGKTQVSKMIFKCGASLPSAIIRILNKYENDPDSLKKAGIEYAAEQISELLSNGADGIHIYSMNRPEIARDILKIIGE
ncbi:MAG: methylenetetrahydrofolate reductase [NAD(P)H] [Clostridiales bacterium]|nr:methylenetetrahydrofolate reductase [NAD(P)H] [Clostridiales bacterium]